MNLLPRLPPTSINTFTTGTTRNHRTWRTGRRTFQRNVVRTTGTRHPYTRTSIGYRRTTKRRYRISRARCVGIRVPVNITECIRAKVGTVVPNMESLQQHPPSLPRGSLFHRQFKNQFWKEISNFLAKIFIVYRPVQ